MKSFCFVFHLEVIYLTFFAVLNFVTANENVYQRTKDIFLPNTFRTLTSPTEMICCAHCDQTVGCMSVSYQTSSKTCKLSNDPLVSVSVNGQTDTSWNTYSKSDWMLVFRGTPGVGAEIYSAWVDGNDVTLDDVTCMTTDVTSCNKNYRNSIVDSWTSARIKQVKFSFYKDNAESAFVMFDAAGSNITSWFSSSNVEKSSWTTLATDYFNIFSITGDHPGRRFLINRIYYGCTGDTGYSVIVTEHKHYCPWDLQLSYPQFLYSKSTTFASPEDYDTADVVAIFIK